MTRQTPSFVSFAEQFVDLSAAQRVLLRVSCDGIEPHDLTAIELRMARELFGEVDEVPAAARVVVLWLLGRGAGKSTLAALFLLYQALTVDVSKLAPGEQALAPIFAIDTRQARQVLSFALGFAKSRKELAKHVDAITKDGFTLNRGGRSVRIAVLPATPGGGAARGRSIAGAVCDEASFWSDDGSEVSVGEIVDAIAPRLMPNARVLCITSAWAQVGQIYEWFASQYGSPRNVLVAKGTTEQLRGTDPEVAAMVARERARDPDNARREFDCEFLSRDVGQVFSAYAIAACVDPRAPTTAPPNLELRAFAGFDLAFSSDASACVVVRHDGEIFEVADIVERRARKGQPLRPSVVLAQDFQPRMTVHGCSAVATDVHHDAVVREHITGVSIVRVPDGAAGKLKMHTIVQDAVNAGRVRMPRHPRLQQQLAEITSKPKAAGGVAISSPRRRGRHGDIASAFVAAVWLAIERTRRGEYRAPVNLRMTNAAIALGESGMGAIQHSGPVRSTSGLDAIVEGPGGRLYVRPRKPHERWHF